MPSHPEAQCLLNRYLHVSCVMSSYQMVRVFVCQPASRMYLVSHAHIKWQRAFLISYSWRFGKNKTMHEKRSLRKHVSKQRTMWDGDNLNRFSANLTESNLELFIFCFIIIICSYIWYWHMTQLFPVLKNAMQFPFRRKWPFAFWYWTRGDIKGVLSHYIFR